MTSAPRLLYASFLAVFVILLSTAMLIFSSDYLSHQMATSRITQLVGMSDVKLRADIPLEDVISYSGRSVKLNDYDFLIKAELRHANGQTLIEKSFLSDPVTGLPASLSRYEEILTSSSGEEITLILITNEKDFVHEIRLQTLYRALPYILAVVISILAWGIVNARKTQSQVENITRAVAAIAKGGNKERRLPKPKRNDAVGQLIGHINSLLGELDKSAKQQDNAVELADHHIADAQRLVNFDSLTGLPNRQYIMEFLKVELARAKREERDLTVMFFDLDGFKRINDSMGHDTGDKVLAAAGHRLQSMLREGDTLARLGGDEFLLVPHNLVQEEVISLVAHKVIQAMEKPFSENNLDLHIGVSIGVARAKQANYEMSELVSYADIAMYASKKSGKGQFTLFHEGMVEGHKRKLAIANSIPAALAEDQFSIAYQPKISAQGDVVGFEALLRWTHPVLGKISPAEFVPIAENGGKIREITLWVIGAVLADTQSMIDRFGKDIKISLNLSAIDLKNPSIADGLEEQRISCGVSAHNIELEVTESAYLENFADTHRFFNRMAERGYHIALDDFGTGFSSLSYLTQIRVNTLKIDKQFVQNMEESERSALVTRSIIDLAKRLRLSICAEGVETASQFTRLVEEGCDVMQGYWFAKPIELSEALQLPRHFNSVERVGKIATKSA